MPKPWKATIYDIILHRIIDLNDHYLPRDREFLRLRATYREAMDQLLARLAPDQLRLFLEFETAATALVIRSDELLYRRGVRDGVRLRKWVLTMVNEQ